MKDIIRKVFIGLLIGVPAIFLIVGILGTVGAFSVSSGFAHFGFFLMGIIYTAFSLVMFLKKKI